jgi:hypothetical protein
MEGISTLTNQGIQPAAQAVGCVQSGGGEEHTRGTALRLVYPICYKSPETSAL